MILPVLETPFAYNGGVAHSGRRLARVTRWAGNDIDKTLEEERLEMTHNIGWRAIQQAEPMIQDSPSGAERFANLFGAAQARLFDACRDVAMKDRDSWSKLPVDYRLKDF